MSGESQTTLDMLTFQKQLKLKINVKDYWTKALFLSLTSGSCFQTTLHVQSVNWVTRYEVTYNKCAVHMSPTQHERIYRMWLTTNKHRLKSQNDVHPQILQSWYPGHIQYGHWSRVIIASKGEAFILLWLGRVNTGQKFVALGKKNTIPQNLIALRLHTNYALAHSKKLQDIN